jgi:single-stranded DNA-specific DHH superfamily exonuclease
MMHKNPITINELNELTNIFTNVMNKIKNIPSIPKNENLEFIYSIWIKAMNEKPITYADGNRLAAIISLHKSNPIIQRTFANDLGLIINPRVAADTNNNSHIQTSSDINSNNSTSVHNKQPQLYTINNSKQQLQSHMQSQMQPQMRPQMRPNIQPQMQPQMRPLMQSQVRPLMQSQVRPLMQTPSLKVNNGMNPSSIAQITTFQSED